MCTFLSQYFLFFDNRAQNQKHKNTPFGPPSAQPPAAALCAAARHPAPLRGRFAPPLRGATRPVRCARTLLRTRKKSLKTLLLYPHLPSLRMLKPLAKPTTGAVRAEYTYRVFRMFGDQPWRADAGSWKIAGRYTVASSARPRIAVGDFRVHFVVEL